MYFRLSEEIALRSWADLGFAYYLKGSNKAIPLTERQAAVLLACDGEHDMEIDDIVLLLTLKKIIEPCERGEGPSAWSAYRRYDNRCFPLMNLMITGKCNFNCLHCFNAADNAALMTEWAFDDLCALLDEARDCGVTALQITGGEPMLHRRFLDILREIYLRDMSVFALNTNGFFLTQEILDEMKALGCRPTMKISLDGIGTHDWMRGRKGAEESAVGAMKLCLANGLRVQANTQVNRRNVRAMLPTARLLDSLGVQDMRIIRTTEAPRWEENAPDACLSLEEYYGTMLDFASEYRRSGMEMNVEIWQYIGLRPRERSYYLKPVKFAHGGYRDSGACCACTKMMTAVTSWGEVLPCMQMSGYFLKHGMSFGNVHDMPLRELLRAGPYVDIAAMTAGRLRGNAEKCGKCAHFEYCAGGCRALGSLYSGDRTFAHEDITKCYFFENGWYEKITRALNGWTNLSEI